jgi:histidyl-tRNA synthetase
MTWELRRAGIATELYIGTAKRVGAQLKYADQYEIPLAILYGSNEKNAGEVTVKNMEVGRAKADALSDRNAWLAARPGQITVKREQLIDEIRRLLTEIDEA